MASRASVECSDPGGGMSAAKRKMLAKKAPEGWDEIEPMIEEFEQQHRDAVTEDHTGKRKNELSWRIHRIHWEKNRFIFDLMYNKKAISKQLVRPSDPVFLGERNTRLW